MECEMDNQKEAYREEAYELLSELESALMALEETPGECDLIGRVFRAMHTIKGSGAMFGFDNIAAFTHEIETVYDLVRGEKITVAKELVDLTLSACDQIKKMVDGEEIDPVLEKRILDDFHSMIPDENKPVDDNPEKARAQDPSAENEPPEPDHESGSPTPIGESEEVTYRVRFRPDRELLASGTNPILLLEELRTLGRCWIKAQTSEIPPLKDFKPEVCYLYWDILLTTNKGIEAIKDVFIFVADESELKIDAIDVAEDDPKRLGEILAERGDASMAEIEGALKAQKRLGEMLAESGVVDKDTVDSALAEQQYVREERQKSQEKVLSSSVRVAADKLDVLVDLVGELVTVQASLSRKAATEDDPELLSISEKVERLTVELRDNTMGIRMMPIGTTFSKFKRLVRDLSNELGKEVLMTTEGGETELDKTVIERLSDPLVHIIRNSIDHGIELPEIREKEGKPSQGTVELSAVHSGANVLIRISDDGKGLDPEAIRAKAVNLGIMSPEEELTEKEIFAKIFAPGFSTAEKVTDVSGRGVGMDVVKQGIDALRGTIEINSEKGRGVTVTLKLPLTLAIIDGLLVEVGETFFILPLNTVEECKELTREDLVRANGRNILNIRDEIVSFVPLRGLFGINGTKPPIEQIVIAELNGERIGFVVDEIIGEHQTVIKNLGKICKEAKGVSGATILADGTVALILDVNSLSETALLEEQSRAVA